MELISEKVQAEKDQIVKDLRSKFPKIQLFLIEIPFHGYYAFRPQELKDVKESAKRVEDYLKSEINRYGGAAALEALPDDEKTSIIRGLDIEAGELTTSTTLSQCVLYPFDFQDKLKEDRIPAGLGPTLIQKITEVSGWGDITVDEI